MSKKSSFFASEIESELKRIKEDPERDVTISDDRIQYLESLLNAKGLSYDVRNKKLVKLNGARFQYGKEVETSHDLYSVVGWRTRIFVGTDSEGIHHCVNLGEEKAFFSGLPYRTVAWRFVRRKKKTIANK